MPSSMHPRAATCCWPRARCSPGPICRSLRWAEGRDPRFLTIVLRGALDGLATVAPVGDPDWIALRGDNALTLDSKTPALKLDDFFALNPAMPNLHRMLPPTRRSSSMPAPRRIASARISTARICLKAACRSPARATAAGSIARSPALRRAVASIRQGRQGVSRLAR